MFIILDYEQVPRNIGGVLSSARWIRTIALSIISYAYYQCATSTTVNKFPATHLSRQGTCTPISITIHICPFHMGLLLHSMLCDLLLFHQSTDRRKGRVIRADTDWGESMLKTTQGGQSGGGGGCNKVMFVSYSFS